MDAVVFRRAEPDDLPAIVAMLADDALGRAREAPDLPLLQDYTDAFATIERDPNQLLIVAVRAGKVVGTLQVTFIPGISHKGAWRGEIEGVRIAAGQRGSGLGRRMLEWAIDQCRARGCRMVQLTTNRARTDAQRFYAQLGFTPSHVGFKLTF
ncbi:MAG TPA: GNAT family N-acetyltransferase [Acetobacteraceae bacterium]|jgi:GNAT superfamily N-acetyltransferase|nr:GNAT family N-acetyltransferase [Acetobacteraceae bacterium]